MRAVIIAAVIIAPLSANAMWTESRSEQKKSVDITHCFKPHVAVDACVKQAISGRAVKQAAVIEPPAITPRPIKGGMYKVTDSDVQPGYKPLAGQSERDITCLAYSIFREAGNQQPQDQYAVGQVHINRLKSGQWGKTLCEVVYAKAQFSWTLEKKVVQWSNAQRADFYAIAEGMVRDGVRVRPLANTKILHYHASYVKPRWGDKTAVVATAGDHIFYKGIK
jgi:spore germination cell wall hydrolase CwlJ-like protein